MHVKSAHVLAPEKETLQPNKELTAELSVPQGSRQAGCCTIVSLDVCFRNQLPPSSTA